MKSTAPSRVPGPTEGEHVLPQASRIRPDPWLLPALLLWWLTLVRSTLSNGDAATYLSQILEGDLLTRTVHIGYMISSAPFVRLLPADPTLRLNLISVAWSLLAACALKGMETLVSPNSRSGSSVLWYVACPPVLLAATTAEVYPAQIALILSALYAWGRARPMTAGVLWLLAMTISPTSVAALPAFAFHRATGRAWATLIVTGVLPLSILIAGLSADYLLGTRGILAVSPGMSPQEALMFRAFALPGTLGLGLLTLGPGIGSALSGQWKAGRRLLFALGMHAGLVCLVVDRYRDVPAHSLSVAFLALIMAEGTRHIREYGAKRNPRRAGLWIGVCLLLQLFLSDQSTRAIRRKEAEFARLSTQVHATLPADGKVVGTFTEMRLYEWYALGRTPAGRTISPDLLPAKGSGIYCFLRPPHSHEIPEGGGARRDNGDCWRFIPPGPSDLVIP